MPIKERASKGFRVAVGVALLLPFLACGGSDTAPFPVVEVTPVTTTHGVYASGSHQDFASGEYLLYPIQLTVPGVFDITVDWTFPSSWIYVYFGDTRCTYEELANGSCPFLISSETRQPKPRILYTQPLSKGTYYLVLYNVPWDARTRTGSDNTETVVYQLGLTVTADSGERLPVRLGNPIVVPRPGR
jgi:hypothetical protein